ncbi:MAG TPA: MlaD family protein [Rugosimonospora sp.]|jgi:phospholipid/cholesterol/gamma-HCH transport system substrate-binding protein
MLTGATRLKLVAFAVIGVLVIAFIAVRYADLGRYVGLRGYYVVHVELGEGGGIFTNAEVTYRGVTVGRVGAMRLTGDGVEVDARIDDSAPRIPSDVRAVVADRSAVGEEYLDLRPQTGTGPYLAEGARIDRADTQTPLPVTTLLTTVDGLAASVPQQSLRTVVDELDDAFAGRGQDLQILLDTSSSLATAATNDLAPTTTLIDNGQVVLTTQRDESGALASFSHDLDLLARQLATSDPDLRRLLAAAPQAATQITGLLHDTDPALTALLGNLLTTSDIALVRQNGIEQTLVTLPGAVAAGATAIGPSGAAFGMVLTFFDPLPCTAGYQGTPYRNGLDTSSGPPVNTGAQCTLPPSSGVDVRGSANAPH